MAPDEIWDEYQWEAFLTEHDRRFDRFMADLYAFMRLQPPPRTRDRAAYRLWKENLRSYLIAKGWKHLGFSSEGDGALPEHDVSLPLDEGVLGEDLLEESDEVYEPPAYRRALRLGREVLGWANSLPPSLKDSTLVQFCSSVIEIASNISKGHLIGYERETIGGNIACVKRGLHAANTALECLHEMKKATFMRSEVYANLYEQTYELRNSLALYVLDLRERSSLGID
ncbi:MAG TPA: hypothetical protein VFG50_11945 [Rhodothermales bacterium]|nr:hypothetical protein [Rhodothermales bacterium]